MSRARWFLAGTALAITGGALAIETGGFPSRPIFQSARIGAVAPQAASGLATVTTGASFAGVAYSVSGGAADSKLWDLYADATTFNGRTINDAGSTAKNWLTVTRTGNVVTAVALGNTTDNPPVTINGVLATASSCAYKQSTTGRFSNTTLTADPNLSVTLNQNGFYRLKMWIELGASGAGGGGFKWSFTGSAATSGRGEWGVANGAAFSKPETSVLATTNALSTLATATNDWVATEGVLHVTAAPQTVALQWAQNTSSSDTSSVLADSYLCIDKIQ